MLKKKIIDLSSLKFLNIINKIIYFFGVIFFVGISFFIIYYYSSGLSKRYSFKELTLKANDKILERYFGFNLRYLPHYFDLSLNNIIYKFYQNDLEDFKIDITQKSIIGLELQRFIKEERPEIGIEEFSNELSKLYNAKLSYDENEFKIGIRSKGERRFHWDNKDEMSYKIKIKGDKNIWGFKEFSLQKPIVRNYTYEFIFHRLLNKVGLININYSFVNLFVNGENLGVYALEENISKELIERNKKRYGPVFTVETEFNEYFPNISYRAYSSSSWLENEETLLKNLYLKLNNFKKNIDTVNDIFDLDKWAKYFAIIDLTGGYHGSLAKSVKYYFNPTTSLFEPIGFDLHLGAGTFDDFIIMDFLKEENVNCNFLCSHRSWYLKFLMNNNNQLNYVFLEKYIFYLKKYSEISFIQNFLEENDKDINRFNKAIYSEKSKVDKVFFKGLGYYKYNKNHLINRAKLIKERLAKVSLEMIKVSNFNKGIIFENYNSNYFPIKGTLSDCNISEDKKEYYFIPGIFVNLDSNNSCKKIIFTDYDNNILTKEFNNNFEINYKKIDNSFIYLENYLKLKGENKNSFIVNDSITIDQNIILKKNNNYTFVKDIDITSNSTLIIEGNVIFLNTFDKPTKISSSDNSGSVIFRNNDFNLENIIFSNLTKPNIENYIFYGGVNFVNTNLFLSNSIFRNSQNEDAVNLIDSNSRFLNITFKDIMSDALDVDFGEFSFENINCINIYNDCLDFSGAIVKGFKINTKKVGDKGISIGENSNVDITDISLKDNNIGIAVKDGSIAKLENVIFLNNKYNLATYKKKPEYANPKLLINNSNQKDIEKILQSKNSIIIQDDSIQNGFYEDEYINSIIY